MPEVTDTIRIEPFGDRIALVFRREAGNISKVRHLSNQQAFTLGLVLSADAPDAAFNLDVSAEISLQIENAPYERAWLRIADPKGGRTLIVGMEGYRLREVGQRLIGLCAASEDQCEQNELFIRPVTHCYLDDANAD